MSVETLAHVVPPVHTAGARCVMYVRRVFFTPCLLLSLAAFNGCAREIREWSCRGRVFWLFRRRVVEERTANFNSSNGEVQ